MPAHGLEPTYRKFAEQIHPGNGEDGRRQWFGNAQDVASLAGEACGPRGRTLKTKHVFLNPES